VSEQEEKDKVPSAAAAKVPPEERVEQLRSQGKSKNEIIVIMDHENYKINEIMRACHVNTKQIHDALNGTGASSPEEDSDDNPSETDLNTKRVFKQPSMSDQDYSESSKILKETLEMTSGVSKDKIPFILKKFERRADFYTQQPMYLYSLLQTAGINWIRAAQIVNDFLTEIGSDQTGIGMPFISGAGNPTQQVYRVMQQMYPWFQVPEAPGKGEENVKEKDEDDFDKRLSDVIKALTINMIKKMQEDDDRKGFSIEKIQETLLLKNMLQDKPQMPFGFGFGGVEYEPVLDENGKPVRDDTGNIVMKVRYMPFSFPFGKEAKEGNDSSENKLAEALVEVANKGNETAIKVAEMMKGNNNSSETTSSEMVKVLLDQVNNLQASMRDTLMDRIKALEESDPLQYGIQLIEKLKDAGLTAANKEPNIEITKLTTDLEKWKFDKQQEFNRWVWEQKQAMEDKKYARKSLEEFGKTLRDGIREVAAPVAQGFREGYVAAKRTGPAPVPQRQPEPEPEEQTRQPGKDLKTLSNEELLQLLEQAKNSERVVSEAKSAIVSEINKRGLPI